MPELRQNFFTKEWVIIATERARKPEDLVTPRQEYILPSYVETCPFCPGNERNTPIEIVRQPANTSEPWAVRVIPNKFAALSRDVQPTRTMHDVWRRIDGFGFHEVVIESPDHSACMALQSDAQVASILRIYKERYNLLGMDRRINHVTIFKNHGSGAGASQAHQHSQVIATPVIPSQVRARLQEALRFYDEDGKCMFCHMIAREVEAQTRVVMENDHFVVMQVFASATPFATHIFPLRHMASFGDISAAEIVDLASVLRTLLARLYFGLGNPDLNFTIRSAPSDYASARHFHWYVSVIPRLTRTAGFELGSGMFINTVLPESAAEFLRNVTLGKAEGVAG